MTKKQSRRIPFLPPSNVYYRSTPKNPRDYYYVKTTNQGEQTLDAIDKLEKKGNDVIIRRQIGKQNKVLIFSRKHIPEGTRSMEKMK